MFQFFLSLKYVLSICAYQPSVIGVICSVGTLIRFLLLISSDLKSGLPLLLHL